MTTDDVRDEPFVSLHRKRYSTPTVAEMTIGRERYNLTADDLGRLAEAATSALSAMARMPDTESFRKAKAAQR